MKTDGYYYEDFLRGIQPRVTATDVIEYLKAPGYKPYKMDVTMDALIDVFVNGELPYDVAEKYDIGYIHFYTLLEDMFLYMWEYFSVGRHVLVPGVVGANGEGYLKLNAAISTAGFAREFPSRIIRALTYMKDVTLREFGVKCRESGGVQRVELFKVGRLNPGRADLCAWCYKCHELGGKPCTKASGQFGRY